MEICLKRRHWDWIMEIRETCLVRSGTLVATSHPREAQCYILDASYKRFNVDKLVFGGVNGEERKRSEVEIRRK